MSIQVGCDPQTGQVISFKLYGRELLAPPGPAQAELHVNGRPVPMRAWPDPATPEAQRPAPELSARMRGETWSHFWSGAGLVLQREIGGRGAMAHPCFGIQYWLRRDHADVRQIPWHGPGGPALEAPLWVDDLTLGSFNWNFWGDDTRMVFASCHSSGPDGEWGHIGYENNPPEFVKGRMKSWWRRNYPGTMVIHGGLFHNVKTGHWLAITCRRPHMGYLLNLDSAGRGVAYDFKMHAFLNPGDHLRLPELRFYYGESKQSMDRWAAEYAGFYYQEPPEWVFKTHFAHGLAWSNRPTWSEQADYWLKLIDDGQYSGISYSLVTSRPVVSGTTPTSYGPDPLHGSQDEFKSMCHRMADRGVPILIWMSHSGLTPGNHEIDDDWFVRGIDGRYVASWGNADGGMYYVNPGHPGYIEYTKKWITFYIKECRCKGIFFDCYGTMIPPDFRPRKFMRYPADTNVMVVRFMEEIYAHLKSCDPEAIILGEGASLEGPINFFSIHTNPVVAEDGLAPRDWFLSLTDHGRKKFVCDQGPDFMAASGMCKGEIKPEYRDLNRCVTRLLREKGSRDSVSLPGDLSVVGDVLVVPPVPVGHATFTPDGSVDTKAGHTVKLPPRWSHVATLTDELTGAKIARDGDGAFRHVPMGAYRLS